ncbi:hypothetical protein [Delftia sp. PE138]|uniref:hypothetical protein n=1 Tax=Delftia sp. PE138 TaxID=1812483 RepID=UPI001DD4D7AD|nr:hypothetical protein [Delftia sp. PE138]MBS3721479.1 hypothetical protein [Delftia sp. PE138]
MSRDIAASIRARLKHCADARRQDFNLTLTHYGLERLLACWAWQRPSSAANSRCPQACLPD